MKVSLPGARDLGFVLRTLGRHRAFSAAVIGTLAVAIGANVAIFSIVNALVFRPFPYPSVERLVNVSSTPKTAIRRLGVSFPDYSDWRQRARSFDEVALAGGRTYVMSAEGVASVVDGARSTASLFRVLGLRPLVGRAFTEEEDRPGAAPVVVLGQALWERSFDGDRTILGRVLRLDGRDHVVVGVMPRDFAFPDHAELWVPMAADPLGEDRAARGFTVMARLRSGVSTEAASRELRRIAAGQASDHASTNRDIDVLVSNLAGPRGPRPLAFALFIALAAGGCVLLIACSNVASLLLARVTSRTRELAIRSALGATRVQIGRLLFVEGVVLALPGGGLGLLAGCAGRDALLAMVPSGIPTWMRFDTDWRVLAYTLALSMIAALGTVLSPALRAVQGSTVDALKESGTAGAGRSHRVRSALVVSEIALTFVLLVGAALMVRTFRNATNMEPGFRPAGLLTLRLPLPAAAYPPARRAAFFDALADRVAGLPGVSSVGLTSVLPLAGSARGVEYEAEGAEMVPRSTRPMAIRCVVSRDYFRTAALPIVAGRSFDLLDAAGAAKVAIVSRALADSQWPRGGAIGRRLRLPGESEASWLTVVGVAGDINYWRLEDTSLPWIYLPLGQNAPSSMALVVRGAGRVAPAASDVRSQVAAVDPDIPVLDLFSFDEVIGRSLWAERMFSRIFQVFGLVALGLAVIGVYGLIAWSVAQRTREIGIRAALGADHRSLGWLVLRDGARLGLVGVALGAAGAYLATSAMTRLLYGVTPHDGWTFAGVSLFLLAVACLASGVPARRAVRMDPLQALRHG